MKDFDGFDQYALSAFKELEKTAQQYKPEEFDTVYDDNFTCVLSNQKTVEVCPDGASRKVTHANYKEYIDLTIKKRLSESEAQMNWIKEGI